MIYLLAQEDACGPGGLILFSLLLCSIAVNVAQHNRIRKAKKLLRGQAEEKAKALDNDF